jgi:hypothetical protein
MDTAKRIAAVRDRLRELQTDEHLAERSGPPCVGCIHITLKKEGFPATDMPYCGHLAYTQRAYDRTKGEFDEVIAVTAETARADDGLCGPEGMLFESKVVPWKLARWFNEEVFPFAVIGSVGGTIFYIIDAVVTGLR